MIHYQWLFKLGSSTFGMEILSNTKNSRPLILGATLYAAEAHETINLIALAMKAKLPYERLRDMIYTHPTMSEALNDLFKTPVVKSQRPRNTKPTS